jgi:predicted PurR-regulated permease PerM
VPAALFLLLTGAEVKALVLTAWGALVVGGIDNLLYPMLVGKRLKMHTAVALVSIVGGLLLFGPSGLILGPVVFTLTRSLLEIWSSRNAAAEA